MRADLTKRADYAIRSMIALARNDGDGPLSTRRIAVAMAIPARFLPQVMADLTGAGLVRGETGRNGGYRLARPADEIDLLTIIEAVEGDSRRTSCVLRGGPCNVAGQCDVHAVFAAAHDALLRILSGADLASIAAGGAGRGTPSRSTGSSQPGRRPAGQVDGAVARTAARATSQPTTTVRP